MGLALAIIAHGDGQKPGNTSERVQVRRQTVSAMARSLATCDDGPLTGSVSGPAASGEWEASYQGFVEGSHLKEAKRV